MKQFTRKKKWFSNHTLGEKTIKVEKLVYDVVERQV